MRKKIITRGVIDIATGRILEEDYFIYRGKIARCGDAFNEGDIKIVAPLIPCGVNAAAPSTQSGFWTDLSNAIGDAILVIDVSAQVGGFGNIKFQLQTS